MKILVFVKLVPDLVEELEIDESGKALDTTWLRMIINEFDDHALEQAMLLKDEHGAHVTVLSPDVADVDDVLYTAAAKGADQLVKIRGDLEGADNHTLAGAIAPFVQELAPDLVLTGVQANNDLDGALGPILSETLGMPYVGYVAGVALSEATVTARKEYPGGLAAEMDVALPAVLGIQAADQPPRYVAVSKVRMAMKSTDIEKREAAELDASAGAPIERMFQPEATERATMLEGDEDEVAEALIDLLRELGAM